MSEGGGEGNKWATPGTVLGVLGMLGAVAGAWSSFDARTARVEANYDTMNQRFDSLERKLDAINNRLLDDRIGRQR